MDKKEKLFSLIKSLTKNEKGYFKKHASFHTIGGLNNYILLFNLIEKQTVYDEKKIKNTLIKKIEPKNFRESKRYLYEMILNALEQYHSDFSVKTKLKKYIHRIEILFNKTLYEQCEKLLEKAEKIAEKFEKWDILIEINEWKSRLMAIRSFEGINENDIINLSKKESLYVNMLKKETEYQNLSLSLSYKLRQARYARNKEETKLVYDSIIKNPLLSDEKKADSIRSKLFFYGTLGAYNYVIQDMEKAMFYFTEHLNFFEKRPELIADQFGPYQSGLYNLINAKMFLKKHEDVPELIKKIEDLKIETLHYEVRNFVFINLRKVELYTNTAQFEKVISMIPYIDENIKKYNQKINVAHRYFFDFNIACAYLIWGANRDALSRFNKIIHNPQSNLLDVQSFARILSLIAHYELDNKEQLPYVIRSTYRFLLKKKRSFEFENMLIRFINKLQNADTDMELKNMFALFLKELKQLSKDPLENKVFEYFDFISWLESKIENLPLLHIVKEKFNNS